MLTVLVCVLLGALGFRLRGGMFGSAIGWGAGAARLVAWGGAGAVMALLCGLGPVGAALFGLAFFAGSTIGWFHSTDLGRLEGSWSRDAAVMALTGLARTVLIALAAVLWHGWALDWRVPIFWPVLVPGIALIALSGLLCPLAYEIGWRVNPTPNPPQPLPGPLDEGPEVGELLFGGIIGAAVSVGLLFA